MYLTKLRLKLQEATRSGFDQPTFDVLTESLTTKPSTYNL